MGEILQALGLLVFGCAAIWSAKTAILLFLMADEEYDRIVRRIPSPSVWHPGSRAGSIRGDRP